MPFIHVRAYSGRDMETKKKAAQAIAKAVSEAMNVPESKIMVAYEDLDREAWENGGQQAVIEPLRDKILFEKGELLLRSGG